MFDPDEIDFTAPMGDVGGGRQEELITYRMEDESSRPTSVNLDQMFSQQQHTPYSGGLYSPMEGFSQHGMNPLGGGGLVNGDLRFQMTYGQQQTYTQQYSPYQHHHVSPLGFPHDSYLHQGVQKVGGEEELEF